MAERRMFAKTIIDSDAFIDMPVTARLLYYDLSMRADDDGFVNSPKKIMRMIGASQDDLKILIAKKFILPFDNGVVVIKHWRIHNYIRKDTYTATPYIDEMSQLEIDENKAYRFKNDALPSPCNVPVDEPSTQVRIGKDRLGKSIDNISSADAPGKHKYGEYKNVLLTDEEFEKLKSEFSDWQERIETMSSGIASKGYKYKSHYAAIRAWARREKKKPKQEFMQGNLQDDDLDEIERLSRRAK